LAGAFAGLTALAYAELGARYPEAAGAAAYVKEAFGSDRFSQLTGGAVAVVVFITTATIARGTAGYAQAFVDLPGALIAGGVVLSFTAVACLGVKDSVRTATVMTIIELTGLLLVIIAGVTSIRDFPGMPLAWGVTGRPQKSHAAIGLSTPSSVSIGSTSSRYGYKRWVSCSIR
jgi:amino acid transporter